jgi:hypothetical protein
MDAWNKLRNPELKSARSEQKSWTPLRTVIHSFVERSRKRRRSLRHVFDSEPVSPPLLLGRERGNKRT